jgi:murein tripeptide amidase MpaA
MTPEPGFATVRRKSAPAPGPLAGRLAASLSLLLSLALAAAAVAPTAGADPAAVDSVATSPRPPRDWLTPAEASGYRHTPDYEATLSYLHRLERASSWIRVTSFGKSGQGRDLPLVIVSRDRAFTPEAAARAGKPVILVQCGIHSGEIEGKDACLALIRDAAVLRVREHLLDHAVLLVVPMFSVDAHERRSPYNRINQNGPEEMGWRTTPVGLNLNRDYVKAEAPEMRALLSRVFTRWWPHLLVDTHTTDGLDYQHDVTYGINLGPTVPASIDRWLRQAFEGRVVPRLAAMGHLPAPYITFRGRGDDPRAGISFNASSPRLSTGYPALHGRPAILVETHMLKPYATRVAATYDLLVALLEEIGARPAELVGAVRDAEAAAVARGRESDPAKREVVLASRVTDRSEPFAFRGYASRREPSDLAGAPVAHYTHAPWDTIIPVYRDLVPAVTVRQPVGYFVPQEWTVARDHLDVHGVRYRVLARAWTDTVEVEHVLDWQTDSGINEGHHPTRVTKIALERRARTFRPGDLWVPLDQRSAMVAVELFEAQAPDGLFYWNYFDTVLEQKEYSEMYVMEPIARRMMERDTALAREFRQRLAADSAFAASPFRRVDFFYRRSPWADPEQDLNPIPRALRRPPEDVLAR